MRQVWEWLDGGTFAQEPDDSGAATPDSTARTLSPPLAGVAAASAAASAFSHLQGLTGEQHIKGAAGALLLALLTMCRVRRERLATDRRRTPHLMSGFSFLCRPVRKPDHYPDPYQCSARYAAD